jgi:hypothetical protein
MSNYKEAQLAAFRSELHKLAWSVPQVLGPASAAAGVGMGLGGIGAGAVGGVRGYREAKAQGATTGQAIMGGAARGLAAAGKGALIGAGAGAATGVAGHYIAPAAAEKARAALTNHSAFARFGQRQAHGLTGYTPAQGLASIRHGAAPRLEEANAAKATLDRLHGGEDLRSGWQKFRGVTHEDMVAGATKQHGRAQKSYEAGLKAEQMGLTSVPGYLKSLRKDPLGTVGAAARDQWDGTSAPMKAMMVGIPAAQLGSAAMQDPHQLNREGKTRGRALGEATAGLASGLLMNPLPLVTQMAAAEPLHRAAGRLGQVVDRRSRQAGQVVPAQAGGV